MAISSTQPTPKSATAKVYDVKRTVHTFAVPVIENFWLRHWTAIQFLGYLTLVFSAVRDMAPWV